MPLSAISAEATDFVLTPQEIAQELQKIAKNPQLVQTEIGARAVMRSQAQKRDTSKLNICNVKETVPC